VIDPKKAVPAACGWWRAMTPAPERQHPGNRGALARLRRCATIAEAMQQRETLDLFRRCGATDERDLAGISLTAAVLAHLRADKLGLPVARQLGPDNPDQPETAVLKPLRFRRLLETTEPDDSLAAFRRLLALAGGEANLSDLTHALLGWLHPHRAADIKRRWVFSYWNADPAPAANRGTTLAEAPAP